MEHTRNVCLQKFIGFREEEFKNVCPIKTHVKILCCDVSHIGFLKKKKNLFEDHKRRMAMTGFKSFCIKLNKYY